MSIQSEEKKSLSPNSCDESFDDFQDYNWDIPDEDAFIKNSMSCSVKSIKRKENGKVQYFFFDSE